jgi:hypothetical protein
MRNPWFAGPLSGQRRTGHYVSLLELEGVANDEDRRSSMATWHSFSSADALPESRNCWLTDVRDF